MYHISHGHALFNLKKKAWWLMLRKTAMKMCASCDWWQQTLVLLS